jgi:hypothetical protein
MTPEYYNVVVSTGGQHYRIAFHRSGRPMIVCRKTRNGETPLPLDGPKAVEVIEAARRMRT